MRITKKHFLYWIPIFYDAFIGKKGLYIIGHSNSGTNWLSNLISCYSDIPMLRPTRDKYPRFDQRVFHIHRFLNTAYIRKNSIYILRDGRDAIVSKYHMVANNKYPLIKKDFESKCNLKANLDDINTNMAAFISFLKDYKRATIDYSSHIELAKENGYFIIKYEDLRYNAEDTFTKIIQHLDIKLDVSKMRDCIEKYTFENLKKKNMKISPEMRKGKPGDWKLYFDKESAITFNDYAGKHLIEFGYEPDESWVNNFSSS